MTIWTKGLSFDGTTGENVPGGMDTESFGASVDGKFVYIVSDYGSKALMVRNGVLAAAPSEAGEFISASDDFSQLYVRSSTGGVLLLTDHGNTFTQIAQSAAWTSNNVVVSGDGSVAYRLDAYETAPSEGTGRVYRRFSGDWELVLDRSDFPTSCSAGPRMLVSRDGKTVVVFVNKTMLKSSDGGSTWSGFTPIATEGAAFREVAHSADMQTMAAYDAARLNVYLSVDGGSTWTTSRGPWAGIAQTLRGTVLCKADGKTIGVRAYPGYFYVTTDCGATWTADWPGVLPDPNDPRADHEYSLLGGKYGDTFALWLYNSTGGKARFVIAGDLVPELVTFFTGYVGCSESAG